MDKMDRFEDSENHYLRAKSIYAAYYPESLFFAICLYWLGRLYTQMKRFYESEENFMQAAALFAARFPYDFNFAHCLYFFGLLYETVERKEEAVERLQAALQIYDYNSDQIGGRRCRVALQRLDS